MKFLSTRGGLATVSIRTALELGLSKDGGLFIPEAFPKFTLDDFKSATTLAEVATILLRPFFTDDEKLAAALPTICKNTFHFPIPLAPAGSDFILELFHGPTCAFKDVGARFLAEALQVISDGKTEQTVMVATSGDTGGAVAAAFHGKKNIEVVILYPKGKISGRQEAQLCCWGGNVRAIAVEGTFDDCQRMVKETFLDPHTKRSYVSANSINLGRILPQMVYYAHSAITFARLYSNEPLPHYIIPSGNLGNSLACMWAKTMGLPIGPITLALNANRNVADYLESGVLKFAPTHATLANAMDVGNPSNLERFLNLCPNVSDLRNAINAESVSDEEIKSEIESSETDWGQVLCPHTATAAVTRKRLKKKNPSDQTKCILVATAHPAKFETIVEPLIHKSIPIPPPLATLLGKPIKNQTIQPLFTELLTLLEKKPHE